MMKMTKHGSAMTMSRKATKQNASRCILRSPANTRFFKILTPTQYTQFNTPLNCKLRQPAVRRILFSWTHFRKLRSLKYWHSVYLYWLNFWYRQSSSRSYSWCIIYKLCSIVYYVLLLFLRPKHIYNSNSLDHLEWLLLLVKNLLWIHGTTKPSLSKRTLVPMKMTPISFSYVMNKRITQCDIKGIQLTKEARQQTQS